MRAGRRAASAPARWCCRRASGSTLSDRADHHRPTARLHDHRSTMPTSAASHAEVTPAAAAFVIVDLGSTNGTKINGKRIDGERRSATATSSAWGARTCASRRRDLAAATDADSLDILKSYCWRCSTCSSPASCGRCGARSGRPATRRAQRYRGRRRQRRPTDAAGAASPRRAPGQARHGGDRPPKGTRGSVGRLVVIEPKATRGTAFAIGDEITDRARPATSTIDDAPTTPSCPVARPRLPRRRVWRWSRISARPTAPTSTATASPRPAASPRATGSRSATPCSRPSDERSRRVHRPAAVVGCGHRRRAACGPENEDTYVAEPMVFVVADGMGGHQRRRGRQRDRRRRILRDRLARRAPATSTWSSPRSSRPTATIYQRRPSPTPTSTGMGTTMTALVVLRADESNVARFALVNVGDSRTYLLRHGRAAPGHGRPQLRAGARRHRAHHRRRGARTTPAATSSRAPSASSRRARRHVDRADGPRRPVHAVQRRSRRRGRTTTTSPTIAQTVDRPAGRPPTQLVALANANGGRDNITVVVVDVLRG